MDFFGMGMGEILLILIIALIIWGPGKIPEIARTLGKTMRVLRKATSDISTVVTKELDMEEKEHRPESRANSHHKTEQSLETKATQGNGTEAANPRDERGLAPK